MRELAALRMVWASAANGGLVGGGDVSNVRKLRCFGGRAAPLRVATSCAALAVPRAVGGNGRRWRPGEARLAREEA